MRHNAVRTMVLTTIAAALTGCTSVVPKPSAITLQEAMHSVGEGFRMMKDAEGDLRTGLVPEEVEVTFNISASSELGGKLYVELSPIPINSTPMHAKAGGDAAIKSTAERGNQITIKFKNILFADPSKTLLKDPVETKRIFDLLKELGGPAFLANPQDQNPK